MRVSADHSDGHSTPGSGGARRRCWAPWTLQLLLLDEPTTGLDLAAREQLLDTISRLDEIVGPGVTTIHVTHSFEELPEGATGAALMSRGRVLASGPIGMVLTSDNVSAAYDHPIDVTRVDGRWTARGRPSPRD